MAKITLSQFKKICKKFNASVRKDNVCFSLQMQGVTVKSPINKVVANNKSSPFANMVYNLQIAMKDTPYQQNANQLATTYRQAESQGLPEWCR